MSFTFPVHEVVLKHDKRWNHILLQWAVSRSSWNSVKRNSCVSFSRTQKQQRLALSHFCLWAKCPHHHRTFIRRLRASQCLNVPEPFWSITCFLCSAESVASSPDLLETKLFCGETLILHCVQRHKTWASTAASGLSCVLTCVLTCPYACPNMSLCLSKPVS